MAIHDKYTEAEVEFIKENYNNMEWDDIIEGLYKISGIKRRKQSIVSKASKIGLKRTNASFSSYTQEEDKRQQHHHHHLQEALFIVSLILRHGPLQQSPESVYIKLYHNRQFVKLSNLQMIRFSLRLPH